MWVLHKCDTPCCYSLGTSDKSEAERIAPALYAELTRPKGTTVGELWEAYYVDRAGRAVVGTMLHTWKALRDRFGPMEAHAVTVADCRIHISERRERGIRDGTIHTELGHLRMVLCWAVKQGLIVRAPHIERPPKPIMSAIPPGYMRPPWSGMPASPRGRICCLAGRKYGPNGPTSLPGILTGAGCGMSGPSGPTSLLEMPPKDWRP
jgi:hypothetical protein